MNYLLVFLIGYLLGGIPFAVVISKLLKNEDIRNYGSGNPGSSNMARKYGLGIGVIVLVLDVLKGVFATLIGLWLIGPVGQYYGGLMAIVGHNWPIYLQFKGGKGVAASFGMIIVLMGYWSIGAAVIFLIVCLITRYASLGSLCGTVFIWVVALTLVFYTGNIFLFLAITFITVMIFIRHHANIDRLIKGTESKFKF
jgi:glycerol-3-phosphate acyltransferase PlsY